MKNILQQLADSAKQRVAQKKYLHPLEEVKDSALCLKTVDPFRFEKMLQRTSLSFICEVKKASPSKGILSKDFFPVQIANEYVNAGADAISVLTEPQFFKGDNKFLFDIAQNIKIPTLRKDFIIDEYMLYESKLLGADAVLLICSLLEKDELTQYLSLCDLLNLSAVTETRTKEEIKQAISSGARIIGVNNRNLTDFTVDIRQAEILREYVPDTIPFIAESGIQTSTDIKRLKQVGVNGVLIGETLIRAKDKQKKLLELKGEIR